jgi:hypothetical protein
MLSTNAIHPAKDADNVGLNANRGGLSGQGTHKPYAVVSVVADGITTQLYLTPEQYANLRADAVNLPPFDLL